MHTYRAVRQTAALALLVGTALACDGGDPAEPEEAQRFGATLTTGAVLPPPALSAAGEARLELADTVMVFTLEASGLRRVISAHLHAGSGATATGPILANLCCGSVLDTTAGVFAQGSFQAGVPGVPIDSVLAMLRGGTAYVDVHTAAQPNGALRGQVERR